MQPRLLGATDISVSNLCLGTMQFGWTANERASFAVMDAFAEAGGNFLDTADVYSRWAPGNPGGISAQIIGRWLKERGNRDGLIIATKVRGRRAEYEGDLAPLCEREGIGVIPYSPLAAGFLTGKYRTGQSQPRSARAGRVREYMNVPGFAVLEALDRVAAAHNTTVAAVALAWQMTKPAVVAPIVGANSPEQLADSL